MKKILLILVVLLMTHILLGAPALVKVVGLCPAPPCTATDGPPQNQTAEGTGVRWDGSTGAKTLSIPNVGAGNTLIVCVRNSARSDNIVSSPNLSWRKDQNTLSTTGAAHNCGIWSAYVTTAGNYNVSIDDVPTSARAIRFNVLEFSGLADSAAISTSGTAANSVVMISAPTVNASQDGSLIVCASATESDNGSNADTWRDQGIYTLINWPNCECEPDQKIPVACAIVNHGDYQPTMGSGQYDSVTISAAVYSPGGGSVVPNLVTHTNSLEFGCVTPPAGLTRPIYITNIGTLAYTGACSTLPPFSLNISSFRLSVGAWTNLNVSFNPASDQHGYVGGTLTLAGAGGTTAALKGNSPVSSLAFGSSIGQVGSPFAIQTTNSPWGLGIVWQTTSNWPSGGGTAAYYANLPATGDYNVYIRCRAPNQNSHRMFVDFDGLPGTSTNVVWSANDYSLNWVDRPVTWLSAPSVPKVWTLTGGLHQLNLRGIDAQFQFDQIRIVGAGTTIFVAKTGSDLTGTGAEGAPYFTVYKALSNVVAGGTVLIKAGAYSENNLSISNFSGSAASVTRIAAYPGDAPVIVGPGSGAFTIVASSYITLSDLIISNFDRIVDVSAGSSFVTVSNCVLHDSKFEAVRVASLPGTTATHDVTLANNQVYNAGSLGSAGEGFGIGSAPASGIDNAYKVIVRSNLVYATKSEGVELRAGTHDCLIEGNTFTNCCTVDALRTIEINGATNYPSTPNHVIRGNILHDTRSPIRAGTGCLVYNNIIYNLIGLENAIYINNTANDSYWRRIYNNTMDVLASRAISNAAGTVDVKGNIGPNLTGNLVTGAGYYSNAAGHDFHLVMGAPPVGAAPNVYGYVTNDFDGIARSSVATNNFDAGAFAYTGPLPNPILWVDPSSYNFGSVLVGGITNCTFTLTNAGTGTLNGTALVAPGPFYITNGTAYSLSATQTTNIVVCFAPTTAGATNRAVTFSGSILGNVSRTVSGTGYYDPAPAILVSPASKNYGTLPLLQASNATFVVSNTGGGWLFGTSTVALPFAIVSGSPYAIPALNRTNVVISFTPTVSGPTNRTVTFGASNATPATVSLMGSGETNAPPAPILRVLPPVGVWNTPIQTFSNKTFTVYNDGGGTLTGTCSIVSTRTNFVVVGDSSYSIPSNSSTTITIAYYCTNSPAVTGSAVFTGGGGSTNDLTGTGYPLAAELAVLPGGYDWGVQHIQQSPSQPVLFTFTVTNGGGSNLVGSASVVSPVFFIYGGSNTYDIPFGQTSSITVAFSPEVPGTNVAVLNLTGPVPKSAVLRASTDAAGPLLPYPALWITPTNYDYGDVAPSESSNFTFEVHNDGELAVLASATVDYPFYLFSTNIFSVPPHSNSPITVSFTPDVYGTVSGSLEIGPYIGIGIYCAAGLYGATNYVSTGTNPIIAVVPGRTNLSDVAVNSTTNFILTVGNSGGSTLTGACSIVSTPKGVFKLISGSPYSVDPGFSQDVEFQYAPTNTGLHSALITFTGGKGVEVQVTGGGIVPSVISIGGMVLRSP